VPATKLTDAEFYSSLKTLPMFRPILRLHVLKAAIALALAAGFLASPAGIPHGGRAHLDPCDAPMQDRDPEGARMGSAAGPDGHGHCFSCHWFRSLRSALVAEAVAVPDSGPAALCVPALPAAAAVRAAAPTGARAPPA